MLKMLFLLLLPVTQGMYGGCPSSEMVKTLINFKKVVVQTPFEQYPGIKVFNGVTLQDNGICYDTGNACLVSNNTCPNSQECMALSQELLFNLRPKNLSKSMGANEITQAVKNASIRFTGNVTSPPDILCMYDVSAYNDYMCLPRFCNGKPCLVSNMGCDCISNPCQLYYAI